MKFIILSRGVKQGLKAQPLYERRATSARASRKPSLSPEQLEGIKTMRAWGCPRAIVAETWKVSVDQVRRYE